LELAHMIFLLKLCIQNLLDKSKKQYKEKFPALVVHQMFMIVKLLSKTAIFLNGNTFTMKIFYSGISPDESCSNRL
jgi:hypothetical protein